MRAIAHASRIWLIRNGQTVPAFESNRFGDDIGVSALICNLANSITRDNTFWFSACQYALGTLSDAYWNKATAKASHRTKVESTKTMRWAGSPWHKYSDENLSSLVAAQGYKLYIIDVVGSDVQHLWHLTQQQPFSQETRDALYEHGKDTALRVLYGKHLHDEDQAVVPLAVKLRIAIEPVIKQAVASGVYYTAPGVRSCISTEADQSAHIAHFLQGHTADRSHHAMISLTKYINGKDDIFVAGEKHDAVILACAKDKQLSPMLISNICRAYSGAGISLIKIKEVYNGNTFAQFAIQT